MSRHPEQWQDLYQRGRIIGLWGHNHGQYKTTWALRVAAGMEGGILFCDADHSLQEDYAASLGVPVRDPERFYLARPFALEPCLEAMASAVGLVDLIVVDSATHLVPERFLGESAAEGPPGETTTLWRKGITQLRERMQGTTTPPGVLLTLPYRSWTSSALKQMPYYQEWESLLDGVFFAGPAPGDRSA